MTNSPIKLKLNHLAHESGLIAEHLIRASTIAALCGALFKIAKDTWDQLPAFSLDSLIEYVVILSMFIASPILGFFSVSMLIILVLNIEAKINATNHSLIFALFGILSVLSMLSVMGAAFGLMRTIFN